MTNESHDELISAYLDGELTVDEQARVEQLLTENAEFRQLYEELCALRGSLETLPRHRLKSDLSRQVIERAERTILGGAAAERAGSPPRHADVAPATSGAGYRLHVPRGLRPWLWPAAAIAAALLVMMFETRWQPERVVARRDERKPQQESFIQAAARPAGDRNENKTAVDRAASGDEKDSRRDVGAIAPSAAEAAATSSQVELRRELAKAVTNARAQRLVPQQTTNIFAQRGQPATAATSDDGLLVVHCDVTPDTEQRRAFENILLQNSIAVEPSGEQSPVEPQLKANAHALNDLPQTIQRPATTSDVTLFYVEATRQQVESTLADLHAQSDQFLSVGVEPAPGAARQQALGAYQRGYRALGPAQNRAGAVGGGGMSPQAATVPGVQNAPAAGKRAAADKTKQAHSTGNAAAPAEETVSAPLSGIAPGAQKAEGLPAVTGGSVLGGNVVGGNVAGGSAAGGSAGVQSSSGPQMHDRPFAVQQRSKQFGGSMSPQAAPMIVNQPNLDRSRAKDAAAGSSPASMAATSESDERSVRSGQQPPMPAEQAVEPMRVLFMLRVVEPSAPSTQE